MSLALGEPLEDDDVGPEYELLKKIGSGTYSTVWEARHKATGTKVAIKKEDNIFDDLVDCKRVLREIKLLRVLQHQNVVKLLDVRVTEAHPYFESICLVLELADSDLKKLIKSALHLQHAHIQKLVYNMLLGLKYIHSAGVIHRDIKPGNILIYQDCSAKVCDFGLARSIMGTSSPSVQKMLDRISLEDDKAGEIVLDNPEEGTVAKVGVKDISHPKPAGKEEKKVKKDVKKLQKYMQGHPGLKSELTSHVVTRWYRAPEIILMEKVYGEGIDVWAVGCIFAELLSMMKENANSFLDRRPLFPGASCYPLSPATEAAAKTGNDQLYLILEVLGTPSDSDYAFITDKVRVAELKKLPKKSRVDLRTRYPGAGVDALNLLDRMLVFNPEKRITVEECLAHPYLTNIRHPPSELTLNEMLSFDFEYETELDEDKMRALFQEEIDYYRKLRAEGKLYPAPEAKK